MEMKREIEKSSDSKIKELVTSIYRLLLGSAKEWDEKATIVKVCCDDLSKYGDLCFLSSLDTWRKVFPHCIEAIPSCKCILEYYLMIGEVEFSEKDVAEKAFRNLIQASNDWYLKIEKCTLLNERVCLFLNRQKTFADTVSRVVARGNSYGEFESGNKSYFFNIVYEQDSELTNLRLRLIKGVAENIIKAHGHQIAESSSSVKYNVTTRSKSNPEDFSKILLCGVAKNSVTKTKETGLTEVGYFNKTQVNLLDTIFDEERKEANSSSVLKELADAAIALEFLAVKPSRVLTIDLDKSTANAKGSSFILYNTARFSAIFQKFEEESCKGNYSSLPDVAKVDFGLLDQEEEWELLYNFVLGYPEVLKSSAKLDGDLEICPQYLCSFLARLCNKFSAYYRRIRILTEGRDHLLPVMMARLYLLKAVQIVTCNALRLLNISPVSRM